MNLRTRLRAARHAGTIPALVLLLVGTAAVAGETGITIEQLCRISHEDIRVGLYDKDEVRRQLARPEVRAALWDRLRAEVAQVSRWDRGRLLRVLCLGGVQEKEIDRVLDLIKESRKAGRNGEIGMPLPDAMRLILLHTPFAFTPVIESKLLEPFAQRSADALEADSARCMWMLAQRLPAAKIRDAFAKAWSRRTPLILKSAESKAAFVELAVVPPEGSAPEELFCLFADRFSIIWPDGKARFYSNLQPERTKRWEFEPAVRGFYSPKAVTIELAAGKIAMGTVVLPKRRFVVRGTVEPAPKSPLMVVMAQDLPQGSPIFELDHDSYSDLVQLDGRFACPYTRQNGFRKLLVGDMDGTLLHAVDCPLPEAGGDVDLGNLQLPDTSPYATVPIHLTWASSIPAGDHIELTLTWTPVGSAAPASTMALFVSSSDFDFRKPNVRIGAARNLVKGTYKVLVEFSQVRLQGPVGNFSTTCVVKEKAEPLLVKAALKAGTAPGSVANPEEQLEVGASRPLFDLGLRADATPVVVWLGEQNLCVRMGDDAARGTITPMCPAAELGGAKCTYVRCFIDGRGGLHVFAMVPVENGEGEILRYRRFTPEGRPACAWLGLHDGNKEHAPTAGFGIFPRKGRDSFEILVSTEDSTRTRAEGLRKTWLSIKLADDRVSTSRAEQKLGEETITIGGSLGVGAALDRCALLCERDEQLWWLSYPQFRLVPTGLAIVNLFDTHVETLYSAKGTAYVAYALPDLKREQVHGGEMVKATRHRLCVGAGPLGAKLSVRFLSKDATTEYHRCALAEAPDNKVYLFSLLPQEKPATTGLINYWNVSSAGSTPTATSFRADADTQLRVVFKDASAAYIARVEAHKLHVSLLTLKKQ